jgi:hypothetical protein
MTTKAKKKIVDIDLYNNAEGNSRSYKGRLLGFITTEEFQAMINNKALQNKIYTSETVPVSLLGTKFDDLKEMRLVASVKEAGDKTVDKTLFVTEPLYTLSWYYPEDKTIGIVTKDNNMVIIAEDEV